MPTESVNTVERLDAFGYVDLEIIVDRDGETRARLATFSEIGQRYNTANLGPSHIDELIDMLQRAKERIKEQEGG